MSLVFEPIAHRYELDGAEVPSVTGVLRASGLIDFSQIPPSILEAARERGTKVHQAIHYWGDGDLNVLEFARDFPDLIGYLESWMRLIDSGRLLTILREYRVASRRHRAAGTLDWLGVFDGHAAIIDFATGDPDDAFKDLQTAGYCILGREWKDEPGEGVLRAFFEHHPFVARYSVRLTKTGSLPKITPYTNPRDFSEFAALVAAQHIVKARKPKAIDWQEYAA